ncbi:MAG: glucose-6-phosphate dehydrogenase [Chloroflexi bacterium]|nr:glucose-6-phosphate dehydrogenase [Chloroflexota bacterium]
MSDRPTVIAIFGVTGDLARRKLIPALYSNFIKGRTPERLRIVGVGRRDWRDATLIEHAYQSLRNYAPAIYNEHYWECFRKTLSYSKVNLPQPETYRNLKADLDALDEGDSNRLYYLSIAPEFYQDVIVNLGALGMARENGDGRAGAAPAWRRIVIEKPFGYNLDTAQSLNRAVHSVFNESQVYRIDHYLGKETAQNILFMRFANTIFEPVWNRSHISNVQVTVAETVDVGTRAGYYDGSGVMRDMMQNHLLQLLSLIAMEPPSAFDADALRNEKVKVLQAARAVRLEDTVRGQYDGYRCAEGVAPDSTTPTFAALRLYIDNWRWKDIPFYLRSGKAMRQKTTQVNIQFKRPPNSIFELTESGDYSRNMLSICIQPDEGIHLTIEAKIPDHQIAKSVDMELHYENAFVAEDLPDAYERLLLDAINGDAALFIRGDEIESAWKLVDPIIEGWARDPIAPPMQRYDKGSWGPAAADELLEREEHIWRLSCLHQNSATNGDL